MLRKLEQNEKIKFEGSLTLNDLRNMVHPVVPWEDASKAALAIEEAMKGKFKIVEVVAGCLLVILDMIVQFFEVVVEDEKPDKKAN